MSPLHPHIWHNPCMCICHTHSEILNIAACLYKVHVAVFKTSSPGVKGNLFKPPSGGYYRYGRLYNQRHYYPNFYTKTNCGSSANVGGWWDTSCRGNPNGPGPGKGSTVYAMWNDNVVTKTEVKIRQRSCVTNPALSCTEYQQY